MTDYQADSLSKKGSFNPAVFYPATCILFILVTLTVFFPQAVTDTFSTIQRIIVDQLSWYYVTVVALILISVSFIAVSRCGDIRLGQEHVRPEYSFNTWLALLFSAGMGIGLMFFGVAEPVIHYLAPPDGPMPPTEAAQTAMRLTFFHWGLHAWSIYAIVALILAYFGYRHELPLTLRSGLYPIIGERIYGWAGHIVDVCAVLGTVCGVATTLGYGVLQINAGLHYLFDVPVSAFTQVVLVFITTLLATVSVASGLNHGVKILSQLNLVMAFFLLMAVLVVGPTVYLLQALVENMGIYLSALVSDTFNLYAYTDKRDWLGDWTILYWGWWLSWAPFVGLFIARVSRGRTIREFVVGAMLVPTLLTLLWLAVFGNSAIDMISNQGLTVLGEAVQKDQAVALFEFFSQLPLARIFSLVGMGMVMLFFVTSANSGAVVVNMLVSYGRDDTQVWQRIFWSVLIGIVSVTLLLAGGLSALQTATVASAFPFSFVLLIAMVGLFKALRTDLLKQDIQAQAHVAPITNNPVPWNRRLRNLIYFPVHAEAKRWLKDCGAPALEAFAAELCDIGVEAIVDQHDDIVTLTVNHGHEIGFYYALQIRAMLRPDTAIAGEVLQQKKDHETGHQYFGVEVHLMEGGQDDDVMGWTREQILTDIVAQYERHLQYLHTVR